jgi:hypothetical protein
MSDISIEQKREQLLEKYLQERPQTRLPSIRRRAENVAPLTFAQEELWRRETQNPQIAPLYNECVRVRIKGTLDETALRKSLSEIVRRHEIWRTTFETRAGQPVQVVQPPAPLVFESLDLRELAEADGEKQAQGAVGDSVRSKFALQREPPLRLKLIRTGEREHSLFLIAHLLLLDGVSAYQIFPSELAALYKAYTSGKDSPLPELPIQYGDFAAWQRERGEGFFSPQTAYWRKQFANRPEGANGRHDKPVAKNRNYHGTVRSFNLSSELSTTLKRFAKAEKTTLFFVLLSAFAALIRMRSKGEQINLGTLVSSGRNQTEVLNLLGYFLNPVVLCFDFESDPTFHELLAQSRLLLSDAMVNADVPIEGLAREILLAPNPSPSPFFSSAVSLQPPTPNLGLDWTVTTMDVDSGGSPWELYLAFVELPQDLIGRIQYNSEMYDPDEVAMTVDDLKMVLAQVISDPSRRLSQIRLS